MPNDALRSYAAANAALGLVIGLASALEFVPVVLGGDAARPIPFGWTTGQAVVYALLFRRAVLFLAEPVVAAVIGYWIGRQVEVSDRYTAVLRACARGTLAGATLGVGVTTLWLATQPDILATAGAAGVRLVSGVVGVTIGVVLSSFAGAAVGQFHGAHADGAGSPAVSSGR